MRLFYYHKVTEILKWSQDILTPSQIERRIQQNVVGNSYLEKKKKYIYIYIYTLKS